MVVLIVTYSSFAVDAANYIIFAKRVSNLGRTSQVKTFNPISCLFFCLFFSWSIEKQQTTTSSEKGKKYKQQARSTTVSITSAALLCCCISPSRRKCATTITLDSYMYHLARAILIAIATGTLYSNVAKTLKLDIIVVRVKLHSGYSSV